MSDFEFEVEDPGDDDVPSYMTFNLHLCYFGIFKGLPLMQLNRYDRFLDDHASHNPPIETLQDFEFYYNDVMAMFERNNFVREYADLSAGDPARFPAVAARLSFDGIADRLLAMKMTITFLGAVVVTDMIQRLWRQYGIEDEEHAHRDPETVYEHIRRYNCHPHHVPVPTASVYGGADMGCLLGRLLEQA